MDVKKSKIKDDYSQLLENNLVRMIETRSGITFDAVKRRELKNDLVPLMEEIGILSYEAYYLYLREGRDREVEIKKLINMVTINETFFFRVEDHFSILKETLMPVIIKRNREDKVRVWCAGCSSGEEVYSIAMTLLEIRSKMFFDFDFEIIGTDINDDMIRYAKKGIYGGRTLKLVPKDFLERYFEMEKDQYIIKDFVKAKTTFDYLNLTSNFASRFEKKLDVVFFRNVFIYFNKETNVKIIDGFFSILKKEGYLFLGPSETLWRLTDKFILRMFKNSYIYQKPGDKSAIEIKEISTEGIEQPDLHNLSFESNIPVLHKKGPARTQKDQNERILSEKLDKNRTEENLKNVGKFLDLADYESAEKIVDQVLNVEATNRDAIILKLIIYSNRSDESELISFSKKISELIPVFPELHFIQGNYFESIEDVERAIDSFKRAIFIDRELIQPREKLLRLNLLKKNMSAAKLEAKNLMIQLKKKKYKVFSSPFLPELNIGQLEQLCIKVQNK